MDWKSINGWAVFNIVGLDPIDLKITCARGGWDFMRSWSIIPQPKLSPDINLSLVSQFLIER